MDGLYATHRNQVASDFRELHPEWSVEPTDTAMRSVVKGIVSTPCLDVWPRDREMIRLTWFEDNITVTVKAEAGAPELFGVFPLPAMGTRARVLVSVMEAIAREFGD